jgi:hypothetical protein
MQKKTADHRYKRLSAENTPEYTKREAADKIDRPHWVSILSAASTLTGSLTDHTSV